MITVDDRPRAVTTAEAPNLLRPQRARYIALGAIVGGVTPGELRSATTGRVGRQIADEAEYLLAHGVTRRAAIRARKEIARSSVRRVAMAMLRQEGPSAVGIFRELAETAGLRRDGVTESSFLEFAETAEQLLAEGFDLAGYEGEIDQACGGAATEQLLAERAASSLN
jgi:hypothetical protein